MVLSSDRGLAFALDGVYSYRVVAFDATGVARISECGADTITVDRAPPSAPVAGTATSAGQQVTWSWEAAADAGSGVATYTVVIHEGDGCEGETQDELSGEESAATWIAAKDGVYSAAVSAVDGAGHVSASFCLPAVTIGPSQGSGDDVTAPPRLATFSARTADSGAATADGHILISWTYPASVGDYHELTVRRLAGATAPATSPTAPS